MAQRKGRKGKKGTRKDSSSSGMQRKDEDRGMQATR